MRSTTAPTSKSPPAGGLPPKEAVLEVTSNSSADTAAAAAVLTISRDRHLHITPDLTRASSKGPAPTAGVTQHNTRATILELVAKATQSRPLGLDCAELWTLYNAATPSTDQITYLLEFERLVDQKIFVPPNDAPPGTERIIMQAGYNYRKDRMTTLPSVKGNTGTSSTPSRPTGTSRIPRISEAPSPVVRYTVKPNRGRSRVEAGQGMLCLQAGDGRRRRDAESCQGKVEVPEKARTDPRFFFRPLLH
ncbi:hypothetical protein T484DRAFT_2707881 [Baffinella frigidus]|nr:hypothetical protein T484DRAFT_2707881 [Cryptophyta sp. CCMP2293]